MLLSNTHMKILKSPHISSFGGFNFVLEELNKNRIGNILNQNLPSLPSQSKYQWKDLIYSLWSVFFCGGDCAEDLAVNLKSFYKLNPFVCLPSPDRILNRLKALSEPIKYFKAKRGITKHQFSFNKQLNNLNIKILKRLKLLSSKGNVLDYDNTYIFSEKSDAIMTHKRKRGYCPGVGIIGNNIVYFENRNGNSGAHILQEETLERMFKILKSNNIEIDIFRADSASYSFSALQVINNNANYFFVKTRLREAINEVVRKVEKWEKVELKGKVIYRGSISYTPFKTAAKRAKKQPFIKPFRLVVTKELRVDKQINMYTGEAYNYHAIITNDFEMSNDQVVFFYNQRGKIEREFDVLKNDFGWNNMPFSKLEQNTVFLLITAICRNIYNYIISFFSKTYKNLKPSYRIKKFIFRFISIPAKWVKSARSYKLRVYGECEYST